MGSVLYFPHIEIRDKSWLLSTLLFWDSVYTIVPYGDREYSYSFSRQLKEDCLAFICWATYLLCHKLVKISNRKRKKASV